MAATTISMDLDSLLRAAPLSHLRQTLRARGLSPAGGLETLRDRLKEDMVSSKDYTIKNEAGEDVAAAASSAGLSSSEVAAGNAQNNYNRPQGQNVGNFLTDRPSSRVLAPPGGASQIVFGDSEPAPAQSGGRRAAGVATSTPSTNPITGASNATGNNYQRPQGQNVGNFISDRPSSRVLAAPGGKSQIQFG